MAGKIRNHWELETYQLAFEAAMNIHDISAKFPREEQYALTDQIRRSSRSVCSNLAEAWGRRRYQPAFVSKLSECEGEARETLCWLQFAVECGYISPEEGRKMHQVCNQIIGKLVTMQNNPTPWLLRTRRRPED
jgi:four helix bundle protein